MSDAEEFWHTALREGWDYTYALREDDVVARYLALDARCDQPPRFPA